MSRETIQTWLSNRLEDERFVTRMRGLVVSATSSVSNFFSNRHFPIREHSNPPDNTVLDFNKKCSYSSEMKDNNDKTHFPEADNNLGLIRDNTFLKYNSSRTNVVLTTNFRRKLGRNKMSSDLKRRSCVVKHQPFNQRSVFSWELLKNIKAIKNTNECSNLNYNGSDKKRGKKQQNINRDNDKVSCFII